MSDTNFSDATEREHATIIECVDQDWVEDFLSDDEIELPKDLQLEAEEEDIGLEELRTGTGKTELSQEERWGDLGIDRFLEDNLMNNDSDANEPPR
jgi:hypothetical protein